MDDQPTGSPPSSPRDEDASVPPPLVPPPSVPPPSTPPSASSIPPGPLDRTTAMMLLGRADSLFEAGEYPDAGAIYQRVIGFDDPAITGGALYGLGNVLFRLDREDAAVATWERVLELPENPSTYLAWRQVAAARVREGDLNGGLSAYREADRRAPTADKAEIAARLGWLSKETGDSRGAARHFRRSRGTTMSLMTYTIIAITVIVSFTAFVGIERTRGIAVSLGPLYDGLALDKAAVAAGQLWRLVTVVLLHHPGVLPDGSDASYLFFLHLGFNMYALYIVGPLVETIYGSWRMLFMYLVTAVTASTASVIFSSADAVGASGAIFGLFGVLLVASRVHHPVVDRRGRAILGQIGMLIVINLAIGFSLGGFIDNAAHIGGLLGGLWLGLILLPANAPTLSSLWQRSNGGQSGGWRITPALQLLGVAALAILVAVGLLVGTQGVQPNGRTEGQTASATIVDRAARPAAGGPLGTGRAPHPVEAVGVPS
jgi:membrane associated rhomboid family serine protease